MAMIPVIAIAAFVCSRVVTRNIGEPRIIMRIARSAVWMFAVISGSFTYHAAGAASQTGSITVASGTRARTAIVVGGEASAADRGAAAELARYLQQLSGANFDIINEAQIGSLPAGNATILVGTPATSRVLRQAAKAMGLDLAGLKPEGFVVKSGRFDGRPAVVIAGNDSMAVTYGAYELVPHLGGTYR